MSDVVKAVAIGALVGLTGGAALGFIAPALVGGAVTFAGVYGGVYTISAVAVGAVSGAVLGGLQAGLSAVAAEFADKPSMDTRDAEARLNVSLNPDAGGKWIFGETAAATDLMYAQKVGDTHLTQVMACAAHTVESFGTLYLNGEAISFSGASATGGWAGVLDRYTNLGTSGQAALGGVGSWPSDANGAGIAHMKLDYTAGEDKIKNGIPTRVSQVIKGAPVYDPRLDSTRGGSGTHRADDQSTWEYNDGTDDIGANWALVVTFYLLGWYENGDLIFGVGVDPDDIDWDSVVTAANICDATVDSKPRYRVGGVFLTSNDHERVIQQLEAAIMGKVAKVGGKYYIWAPSDDLTSQGNIGEDAVLRDFGVEFSPSGPIRGLYNTARGRYVSPAELYQLAPYPQVVESTAVTEDGRARIKHHDFAIIQDVEIAERVARMMVRRSRFTGQWRLAVGPVGLLYRQFDVITLNIRETNNTDQLVRITDMTVRTDGVVIFDLLEEDSSIYNTADALGTPVTQQDPAAHDPSESISLTGLSITPSTFTGSSGTASTAFLVEWDDPGGYVERTEIQFRINGTTSWIIAAPSRVDFTSGLLGPVEDGTLYNVRARHITAFGVAGAWVAANATSSQLSEFPWGQVGGAEKPQDGATLTDHARLKLDVDHSCPTDPTLSTGPIDDFSLTRSPSGWSITVVTGGEEIELDDAGTYIVSVFFSHEADDGGGFVFVDAQEKPSGGSWAAVTSSRVGSPTQAGGNGNAGVSRFQVIAAADNHRIRIRGWRELLGASTATIKATETTILIERLRL